MRFKGGLGCLLVISEDETRFFFCFWMLHALKVSKSTKKCANSEHILFKKKQRKKRKKNENSSSALSGSNTTQTSTPFEQQQKKNYGNFFSGRNFFFSSRYGHFDFSGVLREGTTEGYPSAVPSLSTTREIKMVISR